MRQERNNVESRGRRCFVVALLVTAVGGGCADDQSIGPRAPAQQSDAAARVSGLNVAIPELRPMREALPARAVVLGPDDVPARDASELIARVTDLGGHVMIGIKPQVAERSRATGVAPALSSAQMNTALAHLREMGVAVTHTYRNFTFVGARVTPEQLDSLLRVPFVDYVEASEPLRPQSALQKGSPPPSPTQDTSWGVFKIRAHEVWQGTYGPGNRGEWANVTIIDSGLDSLHLWSTGGDGPNANYVDCLYLSSVAASCYDQQYHPNYRGHGAHVAGIVASKDNSGGMIGVANAPNLFASINVCGASSDCDLEAVAAALDWAIDETVAGVRPRHIVNISIGHCSGSQAAAQAVTAAWDAGILVVASAGNTRPDCSSTQLRYPGAYTSVIAVGGSLENDAFAAPGSSATCNAINQTGGSVSSAGIDLVAPFSATSQWANGQYSLQCGTSMSAAAVSGVAALLWTRYPSWSNAQIRSRLEATAQYVGSAAHFGHGRVDPLNALYGYTPLLAYISGPQTVTQPGLHNWSAYVTGGPGTYGYSWSKSVSGSGGPYTPLGASSTQALQIDSGTASEFWLRLEVTSGGEYSTDEVRIVNETGNPCAPFVCVRAPDPGR